MKVVLIVSALVMVVSVDAERGEDEEKKRSS